MTENMDSYHSSPYVIPRVDIHYTFMVYIYICKGAKYQSQCFPSLHFFCYLCDNFM